MRNTIHPKTEAATATNLTIGGVNCVPPPAGTQPKGNTGGKK